MSIFIRFIDILCLALTWAIIIRVVLSWFAIRHDNPLLTILYGITEPILSPLRSIIPRIGVIDVTPIVAIILLWLIPALLHSFL